MANARSWGIALAGLHGDAVRVDVQMAAGLPKLLIIGLPDAALGESEHRLRAAMHSSGHPLSAKRCTVSLSPAELRKHGAGFDLAIAAAVLAAEGVIDPAGPARNAHLGELALTGAVRAVSGVLPAVHAAKRLGFDTILVAADAEQEARLVEGITVVPIRSLAQLAEHYGADGGALDEPEGETTPLMMSDSAPATEPPDDLAEVIGNESAVRALVVAAAGGHHFSMIGPPGSGKTMLAERLPGILPDLSVDAAIEVAAIRSLKSMGVAGELSLRPPIQAPHHSASAVALIGGGSGVIQPGALSLAAHGVLFLDEVGECMPHRPRMADSPVIQRGRLDSECGDGSVCGSFDQRGSVGTNGRRAQTCRPYGLGRSGLAPWVGESGLGDVVGQGFQCRDPSVVEEAVAGLPFDAAQVQGQERASSHGSKRQCDHGCVRGVRVRFAPGEHES